MSHLTLFFILMLDNVNVFFTTMFFIALFSFIFLIIWTIVYHSDNISTCYENNEGELKTYSILQRSCKISCVIFFVCLFLMSFIPSTKQAAIIYVVPKIINNKQVQALPPKLLNIVDKYFDNKLEGDL